MAVGDFPAVTPSTFVSPIEAGKSFYFDSAHTIYPYFQTATGQQNTYYQKVTAPDGQEYENEYKLAQNGATSGEDIGITVNLSPGVYTVFYSFKYFEKNAMGRDEDHTNTATYTFLVVENKLPLKKWTCTEGIKRLLQLAEPIRKGETPKFILNGDNGDGAAYTGQAAQFDKVPMPEIAMTKQTLRECLQQIGEVLHAEPRAKAVQKGGQWVYEITYDRYGGEERWKHANRPYVEKSVAQQISEYATALDSGVENIVVQMKDFTGVTTEPFDGGGQSLRTETLYARIDETSGEIATYRPIYFFPQNAALECYYDGDWYDITPYLYEQSMYLTQLSEYKTDPSNSRAYGIYYVQGEKGIRGLNYKQDHPISTIFSNYAIVNILEAVSGKHISFETGETAEKANSFAALIFRVTYAPVYNARIGQTKPNYTEYKYPAKIVYNQSANLVDAYSYGENLKGVIARLGNAEKTHTYVLSRLSQLPKAGMKFDDDYYISAVYHEFLPTCIRCTVALTKDFNRISQYIGISSQKRYSQVSMTMALERNILYQEYVVIGDYVEPDNDCMIMGQFMSALASVFTVPASDTPPLTCVVAWGETYSGQALPAVTLPVVAAAFGNAVSFSWEYEDNYSAGAVASWQSNGLEGDDLVQGYFQNNYRYTDYYGRAYFYRFDLRKSLPFPSADALEIATGLPAADVPSSSAGYLGNMHLQPWYLRKDSREKLQVNVQVNFVTNRRNLIIGSALAANLELLTGAKAGRDLPRLYIFPEPLNQFTDHLEASVQQELEHMYYSTVTVDVSGANEGYIVVNGGAVLGGKAWAIVTAQTKQEIQVEDDEGDITTQTIVTGGDLLVAENVDIARGQAIEPVYFCRKREVFDKSVWKTTR